jgi:hypothetical protein
VRAGLATPTALLVGTGRGAKLGILIKGPEVLEATRRVDTVVLDKTGTVTAGRMALVEVHVDGTTEDEALRLAGAVEAASEHPVAAAISAAVADLPPVEAFENIEGLGVQGVVDGHAVLVGRRLCWIGGASRCRRCWPGRWPTRSPAGVPRWRWGGTARRVPCSWSPTPSSRRRPRRSPGSARSACVRCC